MRVRGAALTLALIVMWALAGPALAHDHEPPEPTLHAFGQSQEAGFVEIQWIWRTGPDTCVQANYIGTGVFPDPPIEAPFAPSEASIHVDLANPPTHVELFSWKRLDRHGAPQGRSTEHPVTLVPRTVKGTTVGWELRFTPPKRGQAYLQLFAVWPDQEGCGGDQFGIWRFHMLMEPP
jgi:hypothetical protein